MKKSLFSLLACLFLVSVSAFGQTMRTEQQLFTLNVIVNVTNAQISVNGNQINGTTIKLPRGSYSVVVSAPGYADFSNTISLNGNAVIRANLVSNTFTLRVNSNVPNAQVFINNNQVGTVGSNVSLSAGSYQLRVSAPGYQDYSTTLQLNGNQNINATLISLNFSLSVSSNVSSAQVFINGKNSGTVGSAFSLPPGTYRVKVSAAGYSDFETSVQLSSNKSVDANLALITFTLRIQSNVNGAQVYLNNNEVGTTETPYSLQKGSYDVRVSASGYQDFVTKISFNGNQLLRVNLVPANGTLVIEMPTKSFMQASVDGVVQKIAGSVSLSPGQHKVRFELGVLAAETTVTIVQGQTVVVSPSFGIIVK